MTIYRTHYQFDVDLTLCTRYKWGHQVNVSTTNLFEVDCIHCHRRIMKGQIPKGSLIFFGEFEQPLELNTPKERILAAFESKYSVRLDDSIRDTLFEAYGIDPTDEGLAAHQLDQLIQNTREHYKKEAATRKK